MVAMGNIHVYIKCGKNYITNKGDITKRLFSQFFRFLLLLLLLLFSLEPCISKTTKSSNLKLRTQVGFHDGSCSHMLHFLSRLVFMETVTNGFMQYIIMERYYCM